MPTKFFNQDSRKLILATGAATFFFGFGAGAIYNLYLISVQSPIVANFRTALSFRSAIFGDGIILPLVNMVIVSTLIKNSQYISNKLKLFALLIGILITVYFHVDQATKNLVNWAMPTPWHWNFLGLWHAIYMLSVATLISLFFLLSLRLTHRKKGPFLPVVIVIIGLVAFFILLGTDYY